MLQSNGGYPSTRRALRQLSSSSIHNDENAIVFSNKNKKKESSLLNKNNENSSLLKKKLGGEITTTRKSSKKQLSSSSSTTTKTPRKALGNISNQNTNGLSTKTTTRMDRTGFMKSKVVLPNKTPHTLKTNRNKLKSLSTCNNNNKSITNSTVKSQKKKSTVLKSVSFNDHKEQIVPSNKANAAIRHSHASKIDKTVKQSVCPVEDIEYSAGQTW